MGKRDVTYVICARKVVFQVVRKEDLALEKNCDRRKATEIQSAS